MIRPPATEQIEQAAEWLRINEGDEGEAEACHAVADWILAVDDDRSLRLQARRAGVTVARLRRAIAEQKATA